MENEYKRLGMDRAISRRDFINGVAASIAAGSAAMGVVGGVSAEAQTSTPASAEPSAPTAAESASYPPLRQGLRGNIPAAVDILNPIQAGKYVSFPVPDSEIKEEYDLVIVGAGISGLSAAHFYRMGLGPKYSILILESHDDFGGHAKRNEFHYKGKTFIGYGGTMGIATPYPYSHGAKALVKELGIDVSRNREFLNRTIEEKYQLGGGMFFDKEHFGADKFVAGNGRLPWPDFLAQAPLSETARKDLIRIHGKNPDYMAGMTEEQKKAKLAKISYQDYLLNIAKISPDAIPFFLAQGGRNNKRVDTTPALEAAEHGQVGFDGLGLHYESRFSEGSYTLHFPDGNASVARLILNRLIPSAVPGQQDMNTIVQSKVDYSRLDVDGANMRIRLSSPVVRVLHDGNPETAKTVRIAYMNDDKVRAVRANNCILACYNRIIPSLMPEIPEAQKTALHYPVKVPLIYTNVLIRKWTAFQKLGVARISAPGMYHTGVTLDPGSTFGGYSGVTTPEEPILVHMTRNPNKPGHGLNRKEQNAAGQKELLEMDFAQFEFKIRDQLARMLSPAGFDPAEDILGIALNRWPYGYAYTYDTLNDPDVPLEQRPHVLGRKRFGLVSIAGEDSGAAAFTNQAMDEANRAVEELYVRQGLC
jgi:spermidine dehydrogenase